MFVSINEAKLWEGLNGVLELEEHKDALEKLKDLSFGVEYIQIVAGMFKLAIDTVEHICNEAGETGVGPEKKKAVVKFLDDVIQLPFYLEWLDGPAIGALVDLLVSWLFPKE